MNRIGVFTSGGDAPGMNAAIRGAVRSALHNGIEVVGIQRGYSGMIDGLFLPMQAHSVSNIIQRGGTMLKTARSDAFMTPEGRATAVKNLRGHGIDGLIAIGGDGTFHGAVALQQEHGFPVVGVPGTIDNDLFGTDYTIGFDTAINTALDAIDKIRDTADAFERTFYIEVMGRHSGYIAAEVALACGAEYVAVPETKTDFADIAQHLGSLRDTKRSNIVIVAEGDEAGGALDIARKMKELYDVDFRVCILGHIQRGGNPSARDRVLASVLSDAAVEALLAGNHFVMAGEVADKIVFTPLEETFKQRKELDLKYLRLLDKLAK